MSFVLLIVAVVLCIIAKMDWEVVAAVFLIPALLHIIVIKKHGFAYVMILVDSILVTYGLVAANIGFARKVSDSIMTKTGSFRGMEPFAPNFHLYAFAMIACVICVVSWIIEVARYSSSKRKKAAKQSSQMIKEQVSSQAPPMKTQDYFRATPEGVVEGKDGYYISYETMNIFGNEEPTVVLRDRYHIVLHYQDLEDLCYRYFTHQEDAIQKVKEYGIEHEMVNIARFLDKVMYYNFGIDYEHQQI